MKSMDEQNRKKIQYMSAYITVEASFIFPLIIFMFVAVIQLSMKVHDHTLQSIAYEYGEIKMSMAEKCYYDFESGHIDLQSVINKPLAGEDTAFIQKQEKWLESKMQSFTGGRLIVEDNNENLVLHKQDEGHLNLKNSSIVRWSQIIMDMGGLFWDD